MLVSDIVLTFWEFLSAANKFCDRFSCRITCRAILWVN